MGRALPCRPSGGLPMGVTGSVPVLKRALAVCGERIVKGRGELEAGSWPSVCEGNHGDLLGSGCKQRCQREVVEGPSGDCWSEEKSSFYRQP